MEEILIAIRNGNANLVGEGDWYKDSAYRVYEYDGKYYSIVIYDHMNLWLMDDSIKEIAKEEVDQYI